MPTPPCWNLCSFGKDGRCPKQGDFPESKHKAIFFLPAKKPILARFSRVKFKLCKFATLGSIFEAFIILHFGRLEQTCTAARLTDSDQTSEQGRFLFPELGC